MKKALIIYYSQSGNTKRMAEAVCEGLEEEGGVEIDLRPVDRVTIEDLLQVDAILIGSPTYYGTMTWQIKKLIDESVKYHSKLEGKVGAAFSSSAQVGGGNETTIMDILKAMLIHGMIVQGNPSADHYGPVAIGAPDDRARKNCVQLGRRVARLLRRLD